MAGLLATDIDLKAGELRFYRPKVDVEQTHRLTLDTLQAALAYLHHDALAMGPLLKASRKDGRLHDVGMTERAITGNTDPTLYPSVDYVDLDGKIVIAISVEESDNKPHLWRGRACKRVGASNVWMSRDEQERLRFQRRQVEFDHQLVEGEPTPTSTKQGWSGTSASEPRSAASERQSPRRRTP